MNGLSMAKTKVVDEVQVSVAKRTTMVVPINSVANISYVSIAIVTIYPSSL